VFRFENAPAKIAAGADYRINDYELASRLSFFLWGSLPDQQLLTLASQHKLTDKKVLEREVHRMLADPKADALSTRFASQWLRLQDLDKVHPDAFLFPDFDLQLADAMRHETELFFNDIVANDRPIFDLFNANYTFVNERLARHYGIPGVYGSYMRRVALPKDSPRLGILGQGSILTITSAGDRTSPVQRGAFVMETLFGAPVPRPPPGVNTDLNQDPTAEHPVTVRERLEKHRANPTCAACHQIMDPIGFSLENFDLDGRWRITEGNSPINASGKLVDGTPLNGVEDLRAALLSRSDAFVTSFTEKLLTYALGRRLEYYDEPSVREISRAARVENYRFSAVVLGIVRSAPFQMKVKGKVVAPGAKKVAGQRQANLNGPNLGKGKE
jgi:hypothetical protein